MHPGPERYADRFNARTYTHDEPVGVFQQADDPDGVWVAERLFYRLVDVARGYELHLTAPPRRARARHAEPPAGREPARRAGPPSRASNGRPAGRSVRHRT